MSHPAWVCGLKHNHNEYLPTRLKSHPAWVCGLKRFLSIKIQTRQCVTPCVGVWIETHIFMHNSDIISSHTLRGCVD